jgi:hypothetical protein
MWKKDGKNIRRKMCGGADLKKINVILLYNPINYGSIFPILIFF